jgi:hypothetical protein
MQTVGVISCLTLFLTLLSSACHLSDAKDIGHKKFFPRHNYAAKQMAKEQYNEQLVVKKFVPMAAASYGKRDKVESCLATVFPNGTAKVSLRWSWNLKLRSDLDLENNKITFQ